MREIRTQLSMKNKDIANFREEVADYDSRLNAKTNELRALKSQL